MKRVFLILVFLVPIDSFGQDLFQTIKKRLSVILNIVQIQLMPTLFACLRYPSDEPHLFIVESNDYNPIDKI